MASKTDNWTPSSWRDRPAKQQPNYPDQAALDTAVHALGSMPPLVTSWEVEALRSRLAAAADGKAFLLQGGDCAESFAGCTPDKITSTLKILLQMSLVLVHGARMPVIRVGRLAGQYAKPRSADLESRDGKTLPSYRGDLVNSLEFSDVGRIPDPNRLLRGYERAALTLNFTRALVDGGFADLHHPEYWNLSFVDHSHLRADYMELVDSIKSSIQFMEAVTGSQLANTASVSFFTSHEGLLLPYEEAQTREVPYREGFYNLSTHMPWIGMRTAELDGAHVEYFRGIRNPIGVKVGAKMSKEWLGELLTLLNPNNEPGRLVLIHRMGAGHAAQHLPPLVETVLERDAKVVWCCDPMHGNTEKTDNGYKTRRFDNILNELRESFQVHKEMGTHLGGIHFEMTGENVTECVGGARGLSEEDLKRAYLTHVDPRLNYEQALEMAMLVARHMRAPG